MSIINKLYHGLPVFIVEEHHEAFLIWNHARQAGLFETASLLHFDEHSDMGSPALNRSIHELPEDSEEVASFTYEDLTIASFIIPGVYKGWVKHVTWVRQNHNKLSEKPHQLFVSSKEGAGKTLIVNNVKELVKIDPTAIDPEIKYFNFHKNHESQIVDRNEDHLLDIDLDYFSCIENPLINERLDIEISYDEYLKFKSNRYHRIHYFDFRKVHCEERDGRYYMIINDLNEPYHSKLKVGIDTIQDRMAAFESRLAQHQIRPKFITICRSRFSGYTPKEQWEFIESKVIKSLKRLYGPLDLTHVSELSRSIVPQASVLS